MKDQMLRFLKALDSVLIPNANGERLDLYHIGRSALVWKHGFTSATEDIDVIRPRGDLRLMDEALRLFGKDTPKAKEYGLYLEQVPEAIPPVPGGCFRRATEAEEKWEVLRLFHLEDHDLAVTKLKRFSTHDREDIKQMCDRGLLIPETLKQRTDEAWFFAHEKDEDRDREKAFNHLQIVLRYLDEGMWRT